MNEIARVGTGTIKAAATLSDSTRERIIRSVPDGTRRVYNGDAGRYRTWCAEHGLADLPAAPDTLAEYANHLADEGKAPSTIDRALAAILTMHAAADLPSPNTKLARAVIRRYKRERAEAGHRVRKARPVTITALRAMAAALDPAVPIDLRDRAVIVLGFALGARRSELAALDVTDLTFTPDGVEVLIRVSKTDRESAGRTVALPYGSHPETCPVRTVQAWLAATGANTGPLFLRIDRHGVIGRTPHGRGSADGRLTGQAIALIVKRTALRAGLDPTLAWAGHSLRRGFANETYRAGADPLRISRHGGWKDGSPTLLGYIEEVDRWQANPLVGVGL